MEEPHLIAARVALDLMSGPEMARAARRLVLAGHWVDAYVSVLDSPVPRADEVKPGLVALLYETGADLPSRDEALMTIADHYTALIVSRAIDSLDGIMRLLRDFRGAGIWEGKDDPTGMFLSCVYIDSEDMEISPLPGRERVPRFASLREAAFDVARRWREDRAAKLSSRP